MLKIDRIHPSHRGPAQSGYVLGLRTFARKSSNVQNSFFLRIRLWEPYARNAIKILGVTTLVLEISCVVDHAKLPNLVL